MSSSLDNFVAGGVGGACITLVGQPGDTVKVRMQTSAPGHYTSAMHCARTIVAADGARGLYRGMSAPLAFVAPIFATYFWGFHHGKTVARALLGEQDESRPLSITGNVIAGGLSAIPGTVVLVPGDRVKVVLQAQTPGAPGNLRGPVAVVADILRREGVVGLYRGTFLTLLRDVPGSMAYYGTYESLKHALLQSQPGLGSQQLPVWQVLMCGGATGVVNWLVCMPMDVCKTVYQTAPVGKYPGGVAQVAREIMREDGWRALYRGLGPALARAVPGNMACFLGYEVTLSALRNAR